MASINTVVNGNAESCRRAADWLGKAATGVDANGSAIATAQTTSESCWEGTAADGFRGYVGQLGNDATTLSASAASARQALDAFAADLDTVNARMRQARAVASSAGLTVTQTAIEGPGAPPAHVFGPVPAPVAEAFYQDNAAYNRKVRAFREAQATVTEARQREAQAHLLLTEPMRTTTSTVENLRSISSTVAETALSAIGETHTAANELYDEAEKIEAHAQRMEQLAIDSELTDAGRAAAARSGQLARAGADETSAEAAKIEGAVRKVPRGVRGAIAANPGSVLEDSSGLLKLGKGALKGVPYVGTGFTLVMGGIDVADDSKTVVQATAETGLSIAGGAVGGMAGMELGAAAGSVVPLVGTVVGGVIGAVAGEVVGSFAGGQAGDALTGAK
ncbi:MAG TPA: hypothetical protein VHV74_19830 [Pseudonocardiaceae bacterium]|jgi:uncharacterized protein YukE|nr:hypothetical protein [Pseudonocardiaceae bacterium]